MRHVALLLCVTLTSCVLATKDTVLMVGGKGTYRSATHGIAFNGEKSFREAALAATLVAGAYYSAATAAVKEGSAQIATKETSKQVINASNNAKDVAIKGLEETTKQKALEVVQ